MLSNKVFCLLAVFLLSITIPATAPAQKPVGEVMCACPGLSKPLGNAANCEEACYGRRSSPGGGASSDTRARDEARAREESEARAREEAEAAERDRIAEEKRKKDKEEKDAKFIRDRDAAANTLKGSTGTTNANDFGLKGSGNYGLRDAVAEPGLKGSTALKPDPSKQAAAWRQLHCANYIFGRALEALTRADSDEYGTLSVEALKALEGKRLIVQCIAPTNVPSVGGAEVDVDKLKIAEKDVIDRANALAQRMKKAPAAPAQAQTPQPQPVTPPCTGNLAEKRKCAQMRLNQVNDAKYMGRSKEEISTEEKNRKELGNLVLINSGLEKGEFTSVGANTSDEKTPAPRPRRRRPVQTPP